MPYAKPRVPRIYQPSGAPAFWALAHAPGGTHAQDVGDVADLMGVVPALARGAGCTWANGPSGRALAFDGTTAGNALSPLGFPYGGGWTGVTVTCRFQIPVGQSLSHYTILVSSDFNPRCFQFFITTTGQVGVAFFNGVVSVGSIGGSGPDLRDGLWHEAAATWDGTTVRGYADGVLTASAALAGVLPTGVVPIQIGNYGPVGLAGFGFIGLISDARVYSYALTQAQIIRNVADPYWRLRPPSPRVFLMGNLSVVRQAMNSYRRRRS